MHQIQFRLGLRPGFAAGAYSTPQTPYLDLRGLLLRGGEEEMEGWEGTPLLFADLCPWPGSIEMR